MVEKKISRRESAFSMRSVKSSLYIVCRVLIMLGYTLGLAKYVLTPTGRISYLGLLVDSHLHAFLIPEDKKEKFAVIQESLLSRKAIFIFPGDASQSRWAAVGHIGSREFTFGDFWEEELLLMNINVKEM